MVRRFSINGNIVNDPDNWPDFNFSIGREGSYRGLFKRFPEIKLRWFGTGKEALEADYNQYGSPWRSTTLLVERSTDGGITYTTEDNFIIDFEQTSFNYSGEAEFIEVGIQQIGALQKFQARDGIEVNLQSLTDQDGGAITAFTNETFDITLDAQIIDKVFEIEHFVLGAPFIASSTLPDGPYSKVFLQLNISDDSLKLDQIPGRFTYPHSINSTGDPLEQWLIEDDGTDLVITIDAILTLSLTRNPSATTGPNDNANAEFKVVAFSEDIDGNQSTPITFGTPFSIPVDTEVIAQSYVIDQTETITGLSKGDKVFLHAEWTDLNIDIDDPAPAGISLLSQANRPNIIRVTHETTFPDTTCKVMLIHDYIKRMFQSMTGLAEPIRSDYYGSTNSTYLSGGVSTAYSSDGDGALRGVTNVFQIREFPIADKPMVSTFLNFFKFIWGVDTCAVGLEFDNTTPYFRIEPIEYFYDKTTLILDFSSDGIRPKQVPLDVDPSLSYNRITFGDTNYKDEDFGLLDTVNAIREWSIFTESENTKTYDFTIPQITSGTLIEISRRKPFSDFELEDTTYDDDAAVIELRRTGASTFDRDKDQDFTSITGINHSDTLFNLKLTPKRRLLRHLKVLSAHLWGVIENPADFGNPELRFVDGKGNHSYTSQLTSEASAVDEDANIVINSDIEPLYTNEVVQFEIPANLSQRDTILTINRGHYQVTSRGEVTKVFIDLATIESTESGMVSFKGRKLYDPPPPIIPSGLAIRDLPSAINLQGFYIAESEEVTGNVWNDQGSANKDAGPIGGDTFPSLVDWNTKKALDFVADNVLQVALAADNYDVFNTRNCIWIVGEYDADGGTDNEKFFKSGSFEIEKAVDQQVVDYISNLKGTLFDHGRDQNEKPVFCLVDAAPAGYVLVFNNGDFTRRTNYGTPNPFSDTFIGVDPFKGKIANVGVTESNTPIDSKRIIKSVLNEYPGLVNNDNRFIMFIGDSNTFGSNLSNPQTYPYKLLNDLEVGPDEVNYYIDATEGTRMSNYIAGNEQVDQYSFAVDYHINKRVMVILLGTNDFIQGDDADTVFATAINFVTRKVRSGQKKIAFCTLPASSLFNQTEVDDYNAQIKAYDWSVFNAEIEIVDLDTTFNDPTDTNLFQLDEVHFSDNGATVAKNLIKTAVDTLFAASVSADSTAPVIESTFVDPFNRFVDLICTKGGYGDFDGVTTLNVAALGGTVTIDDIKLPDDEVAANCRDLKGNDYRIRVFISGFNLDEEFTIGFDNFYDVWGNEMVNKTASFTLTNAYDPATQALLDQAIIDSYTPPDEQELIYLDTFIRELKTIGAWDRLDFIHWFASKSSDFAGYNLKDPATYYYSNQGATFTSNRGFKGNASTQYGETNFSPANNGVNYQLNDASLGAYSLVNINDPTAGCTIGASDLGTDDIAYIVPLTSGNFFGSINADSFGSGSNSNSQGLFYVDRIASNEFKLVKNTTVVATVSATSNNAPTTTINYLRRNRGDGPTNYSSNEVAMGWAGGSIIDIKDDVYNAIQTHATSLGINV